MSHSLKPATPFFKTVGFLAALIFPSLSLFHASAAENDTKSLLIEAENFQFQGSWTREPSAMASDGFYLKIVEGGQPAITGIQIPVTGTYQLWTRTRNYIGQSERRRYQLLIDGIPASKESGGQKYDGWLWEPVGTQTLSAGEHCLILNDTGKFFSRCDAVFLTTDTNLSPEKIPLKDLAAFRIKPQQFQIDATNRIFDPQHATAAESGKKLAQLENNAIRLTFSEGKSAVGKTVIVRGMELFSNGKWNKLPPPGDELLFVLHSQESRIHAQIFPQWEKALPRSAKIGGKEYDLVDVNNPFTAGKAHPLSPVKATQIDPKSVEVLYTNAEGWQVTTRWSLVDGAPAVAVSASFTAPEAGEYSLVFKLYDAWKSSDITFNVLPPLYYFQRSPESPRLLPNTMTPQPLVLVQVQMGGMPVTFGLAADASKITPDWPTPNNAQYGFSLLNEMGDSQPVLFAPILGQPDSKFKAGESKTVSWNILFQPGDWREALATASDQLFRVRDYRRSYGTSLTEAAFNIIDLLKNDDACGWNARLKGFWQIESPETVSQPSPLSLISAAILTRDEEFYRTRALPSMEFVLSRAKPHFAAEFPKVGGQITPAALQLAAVYATPKALAITVPSTFFGTSYWQGADALLGGKNTWVRDMAFDETGKIRTASTYSSLPSWSDLMAAYRLDPTSDRLEAVKRACAAFLKKEVYGKKTAEVAIESFANVSFYPYWWDLLDLYEVTQDKTYLDAAEYCAYFTIAQTFVTPQPGDGDIEVNNLKAFSDPFMMWWKNDVKYRLGWPPTAENFPARKAPAWAVSRVGLSLEQPTTYFNGGKETGYRNILISSWAPNLLRLAGYTHNPLFQTYARNAAIGRFANYPGYYLHNYTDLTQQADFPYKGPDITDIYYHHIGAHLAFVIDYLVTEAWQRSQGAITFPWTKQQGYVWFSNRIYGDLPGKIYDQPEMSLWIARGLVQVGSDQINYLTARGKDSWSIIALNESNEPVTASLTINTQKTGAHLDQGYTQIVDGKSAKVSTPFTNSISVSPKGITVLTFPAEKTVSAPSQNSAPLTAKPEKRELGGDWGTLHAFRIRSPFGKDSLYIVLTGHPQAGAKAELMLENSAEKQSLNSFPYEFSVYPWPQDKDASFRLKLTSTSGAETLTDPIVLSK